MQGAVFPFARDGWVFLFFQQNLNDIIMKSCLSYFFLPFFHVPLWCVFSRAKPSRFDLRFSQVGPGRFGLKILQARLSPFDPIITDYKPLISDLNRLVNIQVSDQAVLILKFPRPAVLILKFFKPGRSDIEIFQAGPVRFDLKFSQGGRLGVKLKKKSMNCT